ncbi:hypothetical protein D3C81_1658230 [compost metagenome]
MRIQARDLGVDKALRKADQDGEDPDHPRRVADGGGHAADGEEHARGHAAGDPEGVLPGQGALQFMGLGWLGLLLRRGERRLRADRQHVFL